MELDGASRLDAEPAIDTLGCATIGAECARSSALDHGIVMERRVHVALAGSASHASSGGGRDPTSALALDADLLSTQSLDEVTDPQPQHADRYHVASGRSIIDRNLDLVRLVDGYFKVLEPLVVTGWMGDCTLVAFDLDDDDGLVVGL